MLFLMGEIEPPLRAPLKGGPWGVLFPNTPRLQLSRPSRTHAGTRAGAPTHTYMHARGTAIWNLGKSA